MNPSIYADDSTVRALTVDVMRTATVFQLFQLAPSERAHSLRLLDILALPADASVLSLGCGVGGMEAYWLEARPDLSFTLVNISASQLDLCLADGLRVNTDAQEYRGEACDAVVVAYLLGHVDAAHQIRVAAQHVAPGGALLVSDVFHSASEFDAALLYDSPSFEAVDQVATQQGLERVFVSEALQAPAHVAAMVPSALLEKTCPAIIIYRRPVGPRGIAGADATT